MSLYQIIWGLNESDLERQVTLQEEHPFLTGPQIALECCLETIFFQVQSEFSVQGTTKD